MNINSHQKKRGKIVIVSEPKEFALAEKSMLGDEDIAKFRGVISMLGWVDTTEIVEDGDDNLEPRLVSLGDNVDDDNTFEIPVPSLIETLILFKVSFKDDEDEAASEVSSIFKFLLFNYIQIMLWLISIMINNLHFYVHI